MRACFSANGGRAVVRYPQRRQSSSFEPMKEIDFAAGADDDPYGFKPTDLVVDRDGLATCFGLVRRPASQARTWTDLSHFDSC